MADDFRVVITHTAEKMMLGIGKRYGKKTYEILRDLILGLEFNPDQKGEALRQPLAGFHSLHYSRFRVVYRIENDQALVLVVAAGHHKSGDRDDVYAWLKRMVQSGRDLLEEHDTG